MTPKDMLAERASLPNRILSINSDELPVQIEAMRRDRSLSKTISELNEMLFASETRLRDSARKALDHLGFI
ncbi:hypothetical protein FGG78_14825 [Thioclava sp. BHET1]|uniref:Uncharacterized protein n=1 Tax=Thioclava dalianensis TaxID=1185766 RepID=A0A074TGW1_9RHOB|nr:hypothetical protein [Thioclava dalianensis]KEP70951.1 hypothetical protein DL1_13230 [Thioclava dalianensis]TMV89484.1 hypothetical protein FGG78_14825 [Thioclava sp. BHET1]SFN10775.1 hypothetical protein SAMN05216224_102443 [Thioclava dalianensis]